VRGLAKLQLAPPPLRPSCARATDPGSWFLVDARWPRSCARIRF